jgi:porin
MKSVLFTSIATSLGLVCAAFAQDRTPGVSETDRSILQAQDEAAVAPDGFNPDDHMTGDWGGLRSRMFTSGVEVFGFWNSIFSGNVAGGLNSNNATFVQDAWGGLKFDLEKLVGWRGGQFVVSGINRHGDDLTTKYIGSIYSTQQMVGGQRPFLYQLYLQQRIGDQFTLKLGRFGASDDFNTNSLYGYSLNNGINGNIRNVLFNTRFSAYPFATWAAAMFIEPTPEWTLKLSIFQTSAGMFENDDNGLNFGFGEGDGYTAIAQFGWSPEFFKRAIEPGGKSDGKTVVSPKLKGLPGHYWLGVTYSEWDGYQRFDGTGTEDTSYGFYAHADQMIYQEAPGSDQGLIAFVAGGYYPQDEISIVPFQVNVGLNYKGLIPGRDDDRTMLHFIYGDISKEYGRTVQVRGRPRAESEKVVEMAHRLQITPWSYFQPDVQWVINPGGTGDIPDAVVIGAQMGVTF